MAGALLVLRTEPAFPPPPPLEVATRVAAAHLREAATAKGESGVARELFLALDHLNRAEATAGEEAEEAEEAEEHLAHLSKRAAAAAMDASRILDDKAYRALAVSRAVAAVGAIDEELAGDRSAEGRRLAGGLRRQVLAPTGLVTADGDTAPGWQATAEVLWILRMLRMARPPGAPPSLAGLNPEEQLLYLRWKVERATQSKEASRLAAARSLLLLDPGYPVGLAEEWVRSGQRP